MKKKLFSILSLLIGATFGFSQQVTTIDFDDEAKWTAGSGGITSYQVDHIYESDNWQFTGGPALRQGNNTQDGEPGALGEYSWRLRDSDQALLTATYEGTEVITEVGFKARRWDGSPDPNWQVSYSTDAGANYTLTSVVINNASLDNSSAFKAFSFEIDSPTELTAGSLIIKIERIDGERIMIDDFSFTVQDAVTPTPTNDLMYYWHFNDWPNNFEFTEPLLADFAVNDLEGHMVYEGTGAGYMDIRTHRAADPVSNLNLNLNQPESDGAVLRLRNPSDTRELEITVPSTGFEELEVAFATSRTGSGAEEQSFYYSADAGQTWIAVEEGYDVPELDGNVENWMLKTFDLSGIEALDNNEDVMFKITFGGDNADGGSGNNRIDNFSVRGTPLSNDPSLLVFPTTLNPFSHIVGIPSDAQTITVSGTNLTDDVILTAPTDYELSLEENDNYTNTITLADITEGTLSETTVFVRLNMSSEGTSSGSITVESDNATTVEIEVTGESEEIFIDEDLIYYWHFNTFSNGQVIDDPIQADYAVNDLMANITYPGTGDGFIDIRGFNGSNPVSNLNLHLNQSEDEGAVLRIRNPSDSRELIIEAPTTGFQELRIDYAIVRTGSGSQEQEFFYSSDAGENWTSVDSYTINELNTVDDWSLISFDLSAISEINNNENVQFKIVSTGSNASETSGNTRLDNLTIKGEVYVEITDPTVNVVSTLMPFSQLLGNPSVAQQFTFSGINLEEDVTITAPANFEVSLEEDANFATEVMVSPIEGEIENTTVYVRLNATELGTSNGDIIISSIEFAENAATIAVTGETLEQFTPEVNVNSENIVDFEQVVGTPSATQTISIDGANLEGDITLSVEAPFEISLLEDADFATTLELNEVDGEVTSTTIFVRLNAAEAGIYQGDLVVSSNDVNDIIVALSGETEEEDTTDPIDGELIYYWHFNQANSLYEEVDGENQIIVPIPADFAVAGLNGSITYEGEGDGYMDVRTFRPQDPVSNLNLNQGELPNQGAVLRLRNPAEEKELVITAPSTGYKDLSLNYAVVRTSNGATEQSLFYSADAGQTWVAIEENYNIPELNVLEDWILKSFDLSDIEALDDNDDVLFKISFVGDNADNTSGNNRIDNFSIHGTPLVVNTDPTLVVMPTSLNSFEQMIGAPSATQFITVSGTNLLGDVTVNAPQDFEVSLDEQNDFASSLTLTDIVEGTLDATTVYVRLNMENEGTASGVITISSEDAVDVEVSVEGESEEEVVPVEAELIYYWHFNNLLTPNDDVTFVPADFSLIPGFIPNMTYTGEGNRDIDEYDNGSSLNLQMGEPSGKAARVRNSSLGRSLTFNLSTAGVEDVVFEYAVYRSGSGMLKNIIDYSIDGGQTFTQNGLANTEFDIEETYKLVAVDFSDIAAVNNNPNFVIRIQFEGNTELTNGNNRYDNITLKGTNVNVSTENFSMEEASVLVYPNPAVSSVVVKSSIEMNNLVVMDLAGKVVYSHAGEGFKNHDLDVEALQSGVYVIQLSNKLGTKQVRFVKQ